MAAAVDEPLYPSLITRQLADIGPILFKETPQLSTKSIITETKASSETINTLVNRIEEALDGAPAGAVIISLISLVMLLQKPDITPEQLQMAIKDTSRYICLLLEGMDPQDELPANQVN